MGFSDNTKLLIIHADDAGLCQAENQATMEALRNGSVNSCSIMPPCPWFYDMVEFAKNNPEFDCGIHLTLTSEWATYKWGPVAPMEKVRSLVDKNGFFHAKRNDFIENCSLKEIRIELRAQIEKALDFGLRPTHLDCHMFTLGLTKELKRIYQEFGVEYSLPVLLHKRLISDFGSDPNKVLEPNDFCVDAVYYAGYSDFEKEQFAAFYGNVLDNLTPGLHTILIHPAHDSLEMQAIAVDHPNFGSKWRQMDFDFFTSETCKEKLKKNNIQLITWREIKDILYPK